LPQGVYYRQMQFPSCGRPDIVGVGFWTKLIDGRRSNVPTINIFELKKGEVTAQDIMQIFRYVSYVRQIAPEIIHKVYGTYDITNLVVNGYIVGNGFSRDAICAISNSYCLIGIRFDFSLSDGIKFEVFDYDQANTGFVFDERCGLVNVDEKSISSTSDIIARYQRQNRKKINIENPN